MKRLFLIYLILFLVFSAFSHAKKVEVDCTMISSDVAMYLSKTLQEVRRSNPPENACGASVAITLGHIDADLKKEDDNGDDFAITHIDFRNNFKTYFNGIAEHLSKSFEVKNLGFSKKDVSIKNVYRLQVGAEHKYVTPHGTMVIARHLNKKTYQTPKQHWGMDEPEDNEIEGNQKCNFSLFIDIVWVISEPKNSISGFVDNKLQDGKTEKLRKGKVKFTRTGPNNGQNIEYETDIKDGKYMTDPELPSGHYILELTEPKDCAKVIDENWIFKSGETTTKDFDVECEENKFFTVTTSQKITTTVKPIENYRGINKDLKSYQEDKDTYYVYIDAENANIIQYHVDKKSTRKIHRETYTLNYKSCQYEIEKEDKLIKNMGGSDILKSEDSGWGFEDDTKIFINVPSSEDDMSVTWKKLREDGYYRKSKKYKKKIPEFIKGMFGKLQNATKQLRNESKNSKGMDIFKSLYDYPGTPEHVQCGGKVSMETFLIPPLDALQDPNMEFKIDIRPSNKSEIKVLKRKMNIK